ncbi:MAG: cob(I)yrinic acid a,c-diamide adenosyltransferase [Chloroflexi bacterium]|nr:MAG: cob(I)yrinic acid a,c-diamide adenosyltransferase [Chloroflexota bacterium]
MPKFFTRTGDDGYTGQLGEGRLPKHHPRIEAVGTIDEATASLGLARSLCKAEASKDILLTVQRDLYKLMAELAATKANAHRFRELGADRVSWLEEQIEMINATVEMPKEFILPGDSTAGGALSVARTVVRRAERRTTQLFHEEGLENLDLLRYLNRLSSLCFALELYENREDGKINTSLAKEK